MVRSAETSPEPAPWAASVVDALLFVLSMATLALQIVQVRVFSYSINPVYVYMVISLAMLGIGASGTVLSLLPGLRRIPLERALVGCLTLFAATAGFANFAFARLSHWMLAETGLTLFSPIAPIFALFTVPFFFSGLGVALVLLSDSRQVGRHYFVNLVGSGMGCFMVYPFLGRLGAQEVTLGILAVSTVAAMLASLFMVRRWLAVTTATALVLLACLWRAEAVLPYQPDRSDFYQMTVDRLEEQAGAPVGAQRVFSRWDPVGRIDLYEFPAPYGRLAGEVDTLLFVQDAGAPSIVLDVARHPVVRDWLARSSLYGLAAGLRPGARCS